MKKLFSDNILGFAVFIPTFLFFFLLNISESLVPFYDTTRIHVLILTPIFSFLTISITYYFKKREEQMWVRLYGSIVFGISYALVFSAATFVVFEILNQAFKSLSMDIFTTAFLVGAYTSISVNWLYNRVSSLDKSNVINLIFLVTAGGTFWSMIANENYEWWKNSLSYLGRDISNSDFLFNFAFILSGIIIILLSEFLIEDLKQIIVDKKLSKRKLYTARVMIYIVGVAIFLIGAFPWGASDISTAIHNISAFGAVGIFIFVTIFIRSYLDIYSPQFYLKSSLIGVFMILTSIFSYISPYLNVVGSELIVFALSGYWLVMFLDQNSQLIRKNRYI